MLCVCRYVLSGGALSLSGASANSGLDLTHMMMPSSYLNLAYHQSPVLCLGPTTLVASHKLYNRRRIRPSAQKFTRQSHLSANSMIHRVMEEECRVPSRVSRRVRTSPLYMKGGSRIKHPSFSAVQIRQTLQASSGIAFPSSAIHENH